MCATDGYRLKFIQVSSEVAAIVANSLMRSLDDSIEEIEIYLMKRRRDLGLGKLKLPQN